jgi:hypothetical protein
MAAEADASKDGPHFYHIKVNFGRVFVPGGKKVLSAEELQ